MHNNIMAAGPYTPTTVVVPAVPATENSTAVLEQTTVEIVMNMTPKNRAHFESENRSDSFVLTGLEMKYTQVDDVRKLNTEIVKPSKGYNKMESLIFQDVKTNLIFRSLVISLSDGETIVLTTYSSTTMMIEMIRQFDS
ncbi:hypothetical protein Tco_1106778 [Tanacetum coccineum]